MPSAAGKVVIRRARRSDARAVAGMAAALAAHEGKRRCPFTAERFQREGFGRKAAFRTLVAASRCEIVGYAIFYFGYDVDTASRGAHLADLFVADPARRRGIGRALVDAVAGECRRAGGAWIAWYVQRNNRAALAFYRALGAERDNDVPMEMRLSKRGLKRNRPPKENSPCQR